MQHGGPHGHGRVAHRQGSGCRFYAFSLLLGATALAVMAYVAFSVLQYEQARRSPHVLGLATVARLGTHTGGQGQGRQNNVTVTTPQAKLVPASKRPRPDPYSLKLSGEPPVGVRSWLMPMHHLLPHTPRLPPASALVFMCVVVDAGVGRV